MSQRVFSCKTPPRTLLRRFGVGPLRPYFAKKRGKKNLRELAPLRLHHAAVVVELGALDAKRGPRPLALLQLVLGLAFRALCLVLRRRSYGLYKVMAYNSHGI